MTSRRASRQDPNIPGALQQETTSALLHSSHRETTNQKPMKVATSISAISGSSQLPSSSSCSSVPRSFINGEFSHDDRKFDPLQRKLRRRPRMSDLQRSLSAPDMPSPNRLKQRDRSLKKDSDSRRFIQAHPLLTSNATFAIPDRYTALRSSLTMSSSPLRTSHHPSTLEVCERVNRHAGGNASGFRSRSEGRLNRRIERPTPSPSRPFQPPHYTPSFAHGGEEIQSRDAIRAERRSIRRTSLGSVWRFGDRIASNGRLYGVELGNGSMVASGTNAPMIESSFPSYDVADEQHRNHERRIAFALEIDPSQRVLPLSETPEQISHAHRKRDVWQWKYGGWNLRDMTTAFTNKKPSTPRPEKAVPTIAFRVLDAPRLKDDYYCSVLAYCRVFRTLAVALTHRVYLWTEKYGVKYPPLAPVRQSNYVTCLAFSSDEGGRAILAISRHDGKVTLWSLLERQARFEVPHPSSACSVAFRPTVSKRLSLDDEHVTEHEDLLVGVDTGCVYFYSIDWPGNASGSICILAKIEAHSQNVCGLAWAPDGLSFVSGGNDNRAMLFDVDEIFHLQYLLSSKNPPKSNRPNPEPNGGRAESTTSADRVSGNFTSEMKFRDRTYAQFVARGSRGSTTWQGTSSAQSDHNPIQASLETIPRRAPYTPPQSPTIEPVTSTNGLAYLHKVGIRDAHRFSFHHSAAVKALAFAPWQPTLLATSGGSNDRQIHFHHTETGTTLAVINVNAQVTSLVWSLTRREIVATFGYAQPEHEVRIAVFAWPSCECVISIPWERKTNGEIGRALWAIPYPGGPNGAAPERLQEDGEAYEYWETRSARSTRASTVARRSISPSFPPTPEASPERHSIISNHGPTTNLTRGEGETWASRTEEEGSLIIACCDQTVKFFEVWAGKSKGRSRGLGSKAGVFGGSKVLEGWCEGIAIEEVGSGEDVIR